MRHLFESWSEVNARLSEAPRIALFLDFDGTLTRIRPRPEQVLLNPETRRALAALSRSPRFRITIISGRKQADLRARIRIPGIHYLGLHGWDRGNDGELSEESRAVLDCVKSMLGGALVNNPGVWIEDKDQIVAVHYRDAPQEVRVRTRAVLDRALSGLNHGLRLAAGKNVWEIVPHELEDKGAAARHELTTACYNAVPVYAGDDLGDEPAFAALRQGITVYVGRIRLTRARFHLSNALEVRLFLKKLQEDFA